MSKNIPHGQFVVLPITKDDMTSYLERSGYWSSAEMAKRYEYVLSPSAYWISREQRKDLKRLAMHTYAAVQKVNAKLCGIARLPSPANHEDARLLRIGNAASRSLLKPSHGVREIPPVIKVDLVQNPEGKYFIAEVDVYNPRGLGFLALLDGSMPYGMQANFMLPGMNAFQSYLEPDHENEPRYNWYMLLSEFEHFYEPSTQVFIDCLLCRGRGEILPLLYERDVPFDHPIFTKDDARLLIIPDTLHARPEVREKLMERYLAGKLTTLFPPNAYLGSKGLLPYLRKETGMAEFLPETVLVGKGGYTSDAEFLLATGNPVLKGTVSSGMKQVLFRGVDEEFESTLEQARSMKTPSWILQEQVPQEPLPVTIFDENGKARTGDYYLRVTAYITETDIIGIEVTGRPDRKVHGAPDCIQVPAVL